MAPVQLVALPVFVVFFTNAGAGIDLAVTWRVLPMALALFTARAVGYVIASRVGGRLGGESDYIRKNAWLGYLPQAGVTLGLVGLAAHQLPGVGTSITALGMAVVALNLLVGPVTLRKALKGAGEIPEPVDEQAEEPAVLAPEGEAAKATALSSPPPPDAEERLAAMLAKMQTPSLDGLIRELYAQLDAVARGFSSERLLPWTRAFGQSTERIRAAHRRRARARRSLPQPVPQLAPSVATLPRRSARRTRRAQP
jgi:Kef-type K+ transport system membrane component KefB